MQAMNVIAKERAKGNQSCLGCECYKTKTKIKFHQIKPDQPQSPALSGLGPRSPGSRCCPTSRTTQTENKGPELENVACVRNFRFDLTFSIFDFFNFAIFTNFNSEKYIKRINRGKLSSLVSDYGTQELMGDNFKVVVGKFSTLGYAVLLLRKKFMVQTHTHI